MMKTVNYLTLVLVTIACSGCGGGGGGGDYSDTEAPGITNDHVSPTLIVRGGTVYGSATVNDNIGVSSVKLLVQGTSAQIQLPASGSNTYSGSVTLPITIDGGAYSVVIEATDTAGNVSKSTAVTVTVENPPMPP